MSTLQEVFDRIRQEREYQDQRWGTIEHNPHPISGWYRILAGKLTALTYYAFAGDLEKARGILTEIAATCCAALEQHGARDAEHEDYPPQYLPIVWHAAKTLWPDLPKDVQICVSEWPAAEASELASDFTHGHWFCWDKNRNLLRAWTAGYLSTPHDIFPYEEGTYGAE